MRWLELMRQFEWMQPALSGLQVEFAVAREFLKHRMKEQEGP